MLKMKFSSLLICGLILALFCFRVTGLNKEVLFQENITVKEGESTHITCCWNKMTEAIFNFKVVWLKSEKRFSAENQTYQKSLTENCSTVHLRNITPNDEGEYVCQVTQDIPTLRQFWCKIILSLKTAQQGNKTQTTAGNVGSTLQPTSIRAQSSETSALTLYLCLAAAAVLLTFCLVLAVCRMKNSCKRSERVVIHQTPHSEGEERENNEEEELSTDSSRGSLQWYQVPVYWSYFDVQSCQDQ